MNKNQQDDIFDDISQDFSNEKDIISKQSTELAMSSPDSFSQYLKEIQKFPILSKEEEYEYAVRFKNGDKEAAKILIQSHLRLSVKIATTFRNYGLPITDLVSEGNLGLIKAMKKFDPDKGFRFSTYAMWWIKASIQEYILKSWSLVRIGTTAAQKKLFFNLSKIKRRLLEDGQQEISQKNIRRISHDLNVSEKEVREMDIRLTKSDSSLDEMQESGEIIIAQDDLETKIINDQERAKREKLLQEAFLVLNEREKDILIKRQMSEISMTLEELSKIYKISRERIRQLEQNALEKIKKEILRLQK